MKLSGARARAFCAAPDLGLLGALLHGPDAGLVALRRRDLAQAVTEGDSLRLSRIEAEALRRDPAALEAAVKARGFFAGRQAVVVEGAKDGLADLVATLLAEMTAEDAFLVVTATGLTARSKLRKLFEQAGDLAAVALYPDPPGMAEIAQRIRAAGGPPALAPEAEGLLAALAAEMEPGALDRLAETLALHAHGQARLEAEDIRAVAPLTASARAEDLADAVASQRPDRVARALAGLAAGGEAPGPALSVVLRQFRALFALASHPGGPGAAVDGLRPPVYGPRRDALLAQLRQWPPARLERALRQLIEAEATLRSPGARPERAVVERALLRVALLGR